eukprot:c28392_g6_i1 orf=132-368(-)
MEDKIYTKLPKLNGHGKEAGHVIDVKLILHDMKRGERTYALPSYQEVVTSWHTTVLLECHICMLATPCGEVGMTCLKV